MDVRNHGATKPGKLIQQRPIDNGVGINELRSHGQEFGHGSLADLRVSIMRKDKRRAERLKLASKRTAIGKNEAERKGLGALPGAEEVQQNGLSAGSAGIMTNDQEPGSFGVTGLLGINRFGREMQARGQ
jgi:hypothetical protein